MAIYSFFTGSEVSQEWPPQLRGGDSGSSTPSSDIQRSKRTPWTPSLSRSFSGLRSIKKSISKKHPVSLSSDFEATSKYSSTASNVSSEVKKLILHTGKYPFLKEHKNTMNLDGNVHFLYRWRTLNWKKSKRCPRRDRLKSYVKNEIWG